MDAMGFALKNKMKKAPAEKAPDKISAPTAPAAATADDDDMDKAEQDLAPAVDDNKSAMSQGRKPMGLRERANEKMASIMKEKKGKGSY